MIVENDMISIIDDEMKDVYHVVSKKIGELGVIFLPIRQKKFCFKQTDLNKYLKTFHLITILHELNVKNGVELNAKSQ